MTTNAKFHLLTEFPQRSSEEMEERARDFYELMKMRRTVRDYSDKPVSKAVIEDAIRTAGRAPSGANKQPWHFAVVTSASIKKKMREAAEKEEREFYTGRASDEWLSDLAHLGTDEHKPFLETAPYLIVVFREAYGVDPATRRKTNNYYVHESVGIACGFLIASLHNAGLATLTHTPAPMNFLNDICGRPKNERAMMVVVAGYPEEGCEVPEISKKPLDEILSWH